MYMYLMKVFKLAIHFRNLKLSFIKKYMFFKKINFTIKSGHTYDEKIYSYRKKKKKLRPYVIPPSRNNLVP